MVTSFVSPRGSPVLQPAPERMRAEPVRSERIGRMALWAVIAAALFHVALLAWLWFLGHAVLSVPPPDPIPVKIVYESPPPPPPPLPAPKPRPPPQQAPAEEPQKPLSYRESGKDLETKALRPADQIGPEEQKPTQDQGAAPETLSQEQPQPASQRIPEPQLAPIQPPAPQGIEKPKEAVARHEQQHKPAHETRAPQPAAPRPPGIEFGDKAESGDPYLNEVQRMIDRETYYPPQASPLGIQGTVQFQIAVGRMGELLSITIVQSSGASILDDAAIQILRHASPFPPLPSDYPSPAILKGGLPFYPTGRHDG